MGKLIKTLETGAKIYGASYLISKGISKGIGKKTPKEEAEAERWKQEHELAICESCGKKRYIKDMSGLCVICHKHICNKCEYECDECKKIFCDEHIVYKKKTFFGLIKKGYCKKCVKLLKVKQKIEKMEARKNTWYA